MCLNTKIHYAVKLWKPLPVNDAKKSTLQLTNPVLNFSKFYLILTAEI